MEFNASQIVKLAMLVYEAETAGDYALAETLQTLLSDAMRGFA